MKASRTWVTKSTSQKIRPRHAFLFRILTQRLIQTGRKRKRKKSTEDSFFFIKLLPIIRDTMRYSAFQFLPYCWTLISKASNSVLLENSIGVNIHRVDYSKNFTQEIIDPRIRKLLPPMITANFFNCTTLSREDFNTVHHFADYYEDEEFILIGGLNHITYDVNDRSKNGRVRKKSS